MHLKSQSLTNSIATSPLYLADTRSLVRAMLLYAGMPMVVGYLLFDYLNYGAHMDALWVTLRLLGIPAAIGFGHAARRAKSVFSCSAAVLAFCCYVALLLTYFVTKTGYERSLYYNGYVQIAFGLAFLPLQPFVYLLSITLFFLTYLFGVFLNPGTVDAVALGGTLGMSVGYLVMAIIIYFTVRHSRLSAYRARLELQDVLKHRDQTIATLVAEREEFIESEAKFQLASQLAHDIRSPLGALRLVQSRMGEQLGDLGTLLKAAILRVQEISEGLLRESRRLGKVSAEAGGGLVSADLHDICRQIVLEKEALLSAQGSQATFQFQAQTPVTGLCNPSHLRRVLSNLLDNALEALPGKKGQISIEFSTPSPGLARLEIRDNGKGIAPDVLTQLGTRGFTHGKENGNGLGLHYCMTIVKSWGGTLEISSHSGAGTTVTLSLPSTPLSPPTPPT